MNLNPFSSGEDYTGAWDKFTGYAGQSEANEANLTIARETNQQNLDIFNRNLQFQEEMANTAHQRGVADMRAAGINPMAAYASGGSGAAPSPSGSTAQMQRAEMKNPDYGVQSSVLGSINTALALRKTEAEIDKTKAETVRTTAEAGIKQYEEGKKRTTTSPFRFVGDAYDWLSDSIQGKFDNSAKSRMKSKEEKDKKYLFKEDNEDSTFTRYLKGKWNKFIGNSF